MSPADQTGADDLADGAAYRRYACSWPKTPSSSRNCSYQPCKPISKAKKTFLPGRMPMARHLRHTASYSIDRKKNGQHGHPYQFAACRDTTSGKQNADSINEQQNYPSVDDIKDWCTGVIRIPICKSGMEPKHQLVQVVGEYQYHQNDCHADSNRALVSRHDGVFRYFFPRCSIHEQYVREGLEIMQNRG